MQFHPEVASPICKLPSEANFKKLGQLIQISTKVKGMPTVALNSLAGGEWPEFVWLGA